MIACTEENYGDVNQTIITKSDINPAFTVETITANKFKLIPTNDENVIFSKWDLGDGLGFTKYNTGDTLFLPDAGNYTIKRFVAGAGGVTSDTISQTIVVATSDPNSGNLVLGSKFATTDDIAEWTIGGTGSTDGVWTFANSKATLTASGYGGRGIYQPITVEAGKTYKINMYVSSTTGVSETWFEVYCGYANPATVSGDYSEGGALYVINTWAGTGNSAFAGKFSVVGPTDKNGVFTATTSGTVYLVIRGGGNDMKAGISITNVEFRGM